MANELIRRVIAAKDELLGPSPEEWYDLLEREERPLESELEEVVEHDPQLGLEAVPPLYRFWFARGRLDRGRQWIDRLLSAAGEAPTAALAGGLVAAGSAAFRQGDNETAKRDARRALEIARSLARTDLESEALLCLARAGLRDQDPPAVRAAAGEARRLAEATGDVDRELSAIHCLAEAARMAGDLGEARALYTDSLERNRARGARLLVAVELSNFGYVEKAAGRLGEAEACLRQAIPIALEIKNTYILAHNLVALAAILAAAGREDEAAPLIGKADALFDESGLMLDPADKPEYDEAVASARKALGDEPYARALANGLQLDPSTL